ncbi:MAG: hypothetical protein P1P89_11965 [Desulfobacterales bacterium]|nr:hypothetical protein [Desulfobacterales bacterium]
MIEPYLIKSKRAQLASLIVLTILLISCASFGPTKPNIPYAGNLHPAILKDLAEKNPLLATEIGKLPEIQDGISPQDEETLKRLCDLYNENSAGFDKAFAEMYQIGIPEVRKFCSPLQALFWLVEDGREDLTKQIMSGYSLKKLLIYSWVFRKMNVDKKESERWNDFGTVADRLNDPLLVIFYTRYNFSYIPESIKKVQTPKETFYQKGGVCRHYSSFATECSVRSGHDIKNLTVCWGSGWDEGHTVGIERKPNTDLYRIVMDSRTLRIGEYISLEEIKRYVSGGKKITFWSLETNGELISRIRSAKK